MQDSIDKIVTSYFSACAEHEFTYKNQTFNPKKLIVSKQISRGLICPTMCGGCCKRHTRDFVPTEKVPQYASEQRLIVLNSKQYPVFSDMQRHGNTMCSHLDSIGRCKVHSETPLSCDFELIRFSIFKDVESANRVTSRLYARGHQMKTICGTIGAKCEMTDINELSKIDTVRKLKRLELWMNYFELENKISKIIDFINTGDADYMEI